MINIQKQLLQTLAIFAYQDAQYQPRLYTFLEHLLWCYSCSNKSFKTDNGHARSSVPSMDRNATRLTGHGRAASCILEPLCRQNHISIGVAMGMQVVCVPAHGATRGPDAPATDAHRCKHPARSTALRSSCFLLTFCQNYCTHVQDNALQPCM